MTATSHHYQLLLLDDEQNVLNALKRELGTQQVEGHQFTVETFTSPALALARAQEKPFDLVMADYRMPQMDGIVFLHRLASILPDAARLLISGQVDMDAVQQAINESHIYRFIPKPWDHTFLINSIRQALAWRGQLLRNRQIADIAKKAGIKLPPMEHETVYEVMIVDDSPAIAHALWRDLTVHSHFDAIYATMQQEAGEKAASSQPPTFNVATFTSPLEALAAARHKTFHCVIADYRMPEMNGIEMLKAMLKLQPDCARIMVSANTDLDLMLDAINNAQVHSYINKPWSAFELKLVVTDAIVQRNIGLENRMLAAALLKQQKHV